MLNNLVVFGYIILSPPLRSTPTATHPVPSHTCTNIITKAPKHTTSPYTRAQPLTPHHHTYSHIILNTPKRTIPPYTTHNIPPYTCTLTQPHALSNQTYTHIIPNTPKHTISPRTPTEPRSPSTIYLQFRTTTTLILHTQHPSQPPKKMPK